MIRFFPNNSDKLTSVSLDVIVTWTITKDASGPAKLAAKVHPTMSLSLPQKSLFTSITFSSDNIAYTGCSNGHVYKWKDTTSVGSY
jgi:hypothetical protein